MADQLSAIVYKYDIFTPPSFGGFVQTPSTPLAGPATALAVLPVTMNGDGRTQIVQLWNNGGRLAMNIYGPTPAGTYVDWGKIPDVGAGSAAMAFLPVTMNGDGRTQIVQLWNNGGRLGINVYAPHSNGTSGSYSLLWSSGNVGEGSGAVAFVPVTMKGDGRTQIVQFWDNGGKLGAIVYAPQPNGSYTVLSGSGDIGAPSGALAFIPVTMNGDRKSQIVHLMPDVSPSSMRLNVYALQPNGLLGILSSTSLVHRPTAVAHLPVTINDDGRTQIVEFYDNQSGTPFNLGCTIYAPQANGLYAALSDQPKTGADLPALTFLTVSTIGFVGTGILQIFRLTEGGRFFYALYAPVSANHTQYGEVVGGGVLGEVADSTLAFLAVTMNGDGKSQIVQLVAPPLPPPVTVPDVIQTFAPQAQSAVQAVGLVPKFTGASPSNKTWVFSQSPPAGSKVAKGTLVNMFLHTGPLP